MLIKIGTRKGRLALVQTKLVIDKIKCYYPKTSFKIIPIVTTGDLFKDRSLSLIGGKGLFLKELEIALISRQIDIAVHSLKDVPGNLPEPLKISAVLKRDDPRDVLISLKYKNIEDLPYKAVIGTSSPRRKILLKAKRPDLNIISYRGNIDTRINKFFSYEKTINHHRLDAIILAAAGLKRINLFDEKFCHIISVDQMLPAIGQGVIAVEARKDNILMQEILNTINDLTTWKLIEVERAFLEYLGVSCQTPVGAYTQYCQDNINIKGDFMLGNINKKFLVFHTEIGHSSKPREIGVKAAKAMLNNNK